MSKKKKDQQELGFDVDVTATDGVKIPLRIQIQYPDGYGYYAAKALQAMPENMDGVWDELIHRQDASTLKVMMNSKHYQGGDDE
ncbi:hypothetical protein [Pseudarthrobacter sp. PS3-L1]|uniref:hypothetical protein n=1 Tax=Pseudarthrobacter sp. PS3-L1 TaxID=3046207 RepID=UPI0024BB2E84|nr:hypothetical protein [Pseudarthrobacter sp. PS3-L1]MDJ0322146.1 hypothetical protein [Pseudarthrobacter sp. PS3-L1]